MNRKDLEYFKKKLLKDKKEALHTLEIEDTNGVHSSLQNYYSELSLYDNHPADIASETYEMEMHMNLEDKELKHLHKIEKALEKIKNGTYGICEACGKKIEFNRLDIIPETELCMKCSKNDVPLTTKMETRPIEEDSLKNPYSKTFNDNSEFSSFDGEDSWQAVARFNKTNYKNMALDWYDNNMYDENISGKVEDVDDISYDYYRRQLDEKND